MPVTVSFVVVCDPPSTLSAALVEIVRKAITKRRHIGAAKPVVANTTAVNFDLTQPRLLDERDMAPSKK